jgi:hypothetical protein
MLSGIADRNSTSRGFQPRDENKAINMNGGRKGNTRKPSHQTTRWPPRPADKETPQVSGKNAVQVIGAERELRHGLATSLSVRWTGAAAA